MDQLQLLGVALGLASLAGLNLYLTVFASGLAIEQGWVTLTGPFQSLAVLGHPAVVITAGILFVLEFFADKVPWIDSIWDAVHTLIRPLGGAFLAVKVMGPTDPTFDVIIALMGGGVSFMTHASKAGTRLVANTSPEPFSNIALSLTEDVVVLGGLALIHYNPVIALGVVLLVLAAIIVLAPRVYRSLRVKLHLLARKLNAPAGGAPEAALGSILPKDYQESFARLNPLGEQIAWAVPCVTGASKILAPNLRGWLVATVEERHQLHFVRRRLWNSPGQTLEVGCWKVTRESKFLSENVLLEDPAMAKSRLLFLFDRTQGTLADAVAASLRERLCPQEVSAPAEVEVVP